MDYEILNYRFAQQILEHFTFREDFESVLQIIRECPIYIYPNKSTANEKLDVVQQLLNTYFDRRFAVDLGWDYHPNATTIDDSQLAADFRTTFNADQETSLTIQSEVQFGNAARWYSDIFKFQTAYSQDLIDIGLSIVPLNELAKRIDSNITNFERCRRELPSADMSITLPVLTIGVIPDRDTTIIDISRSRFTSLGQITGRYMTENRFRVVNNLLQGVDIRQIGVDSEIGPVPNAPE